uniref:ZF(C2H2)-128 zinc finger protein n=1 Tax=Phallusia mammillata TaxID=59560 RepID=A0A6F9D815_9ASCI|nr:ZF(C2H2)-128 zinc finger protein [Phallusia mammillata]
MALPLKRSSRTIKVTQRLADSKKQEESFKRRGTSSDGSQKETLAQALKRKRESVVNVLDKIEFEKRDEYSLKELRIMDGPTLLRLFAIKSTMKDETVAYRCQFSPKICEKMFYKPNEKSNYRLMCGHLLEHVLMHAKKSLRNPSFYTKKRYFPCNVERQESSHSPPSTYQTLLTKQHVVEHSPNKIMVIKEEPALTIGGFPTTEVEELFVSPDAKEALFSAIALRPMKEEVSSSRKKKRINTRLNRKKVTAEKKESIEQRRQKQLLKRFRNQPTVVIEDIAAQHRNLNSSVNVTDFLSTSHQENNSDCASDFSADSTDSEDQPSMVLSRNKSLLASLPPTKQKLNRPSYSRMKTVPSILRRPRKSTNTALLTSTDPISNIKIESYKSLAAGEDNDQGFINVVDTDTEKSDESGSDVEAEEEEVENSNSSSDIASDSSVWNSDREDEPTMGVPQIRKAPRKQKLVAVEEDEPEEKVGQELSGLDLSRYAISHDHCYTGDRSYVVGSCTIEKNAAKGLSSSKFLDMISKENRDLAKKSNVKAKEVIRVLTKSQVRYNNEYRLQGPSSKKIETSEDPKIKARALKLISELRHRKPKEVMVCTERIVSDGQSSFIVQDFYSCEICGKRFTAPNSLYGHYRGHAGIKPFRCDVCGKTFTRSHSLSYHAMIHTNSARFECQYCKRRFRHPTHYKEHLHRHTGEEPYHCTDCPRRFKTRNTYRRHMIAKHHKKITPMGSVPFQTRILQTETVTMNT